LELFFKGREVSLLEALDLERFEDLDPATGIWVGFPVEEGGLRHTEFFRDGAETPTIGAEAEEFFFLIGFYRRKRR
jgi:hypothetical protein